MTLLRQAKEQKQKTKKEAFFQLANDEFENLHNTTGGPLEYLGKSLIYKAQNDTEEEVKCLELALRKFPKHPLKSVLIENIVSRLYETSQSERKEAYHFALLALRYIPHLPDVHAIIEVLESHIEPFFFFVPSADTEEYLSVHLAFLLHRPNVLKDMLEMGLDSVNKQNAKVALLLMGEDEDDTILQEKTPPLIYAYFLYLLITSRNPSIALKNLPKEVTDEIKSLFFWQALAKEDWKESKKIVDSIPIETLTNEKNPFFFLYGCYLGHTEGEQAAIDHLTNISEEPFPPLATIFSHYLLGRIDLKKGWIDKRFNGKRCASMDRLLSTPNVLEALKYFQ